MNEKTGLLTTFWIQQEEEIKKMNELTEQNQKLVEENEQYKQVIVILAFRYD